MLPALPTGRASASGARPSASTISQAPGLLPLEPVRVDRVHDHGQALLAEPADGGQRGVEVAVDHDQPGPGGERLRQLAARHLAGGQDDVARQPGSGGVCGRDADVLPVDAHTTACAPDPSPGSRRAPSLGP